jgi:hypothetical protein
LVVSNSHFKDFRYPLTLNEAGNVIAVRAPGNSIVPVLLTRAKKQGAKLLLDSILDAETKTAVQNIWGK